MTSFTCPHCKKNTITAKQKYLAGKWVDAYCSECGGRSCQIPVLMVVVYFFYMWDVILFSYVAYLKHSWEYVVVMILGFLALDAINFYIPLAAMKRKASATSS